MEDGGEGGIDNSQGDGGGGGGGGGDGGGGGGGHRDQRRRRRARALLMQTEPVPGALAHPGTHARARARPSGRP